MEHLPDLKDLQKDWGTAEEHLVSESGWRKPPVPRGFRVVPGAGKIAGLLAASRRALQDTVAVLKSQKSLPWIQASRLPWRITPGT